MVSATPLVGHRGVRTEFGDADAADQGKPGTSDHGGEESARRARLRIAREDARAREGLGRSRGGLTTKIHLGADLACRTLVALVSPGQRSDARGFDPVLARLRLTRRGRGRPRTRPDVILADKAYASAATRAHLRRRGIRAAIPVKTDQASHRRARGSAGGRPPAFDPDAYRDRNTVERAIGRLKRYRAIALRSDKRLYVFTGTVNLATIDLWLRDLTRDDPPNTT